MSEWNEYKLGDCVEMQKGFAFKSSDYMNHGIKIIKVSNLNQKRFDDNSCVFISPILAEQYSRYSLIEDDIIISTVGSWPSNPESVVGKVCRVPKIINGSLLNQNAVRLRVKTNFNQRFIYYILSSSNFSSFIANTAQGSANQASITLDDIRSYIFISPNIKGQEEIESILSSLDDKIAVNKKICENLEAQAQALFKHWFVDFAPFKDVKFVESELGLIPEGWRVGTLGELGDIVGGATPSKAEDSYYTNKGIAWLTPKDLSNKLLKFTSRGEIDITQEGYNNCSAKLMPKGSVLFSSRAPIGYLTIAKNDICTNQGFKSVVPKYAGTAYIYYLLKTNTKRIESMSSGTTFKEASGSLMKSLAVIIPPKNIIDNYEASVVDIFNEQEVIEEESSRLASLRDTLLPKLMSGQIKL